MVPMSKTAIKYLIVEPPSINNASSINNMVIELLTERTIVSVKALFAYISMLDLSAVPYSLILSKITIVSCTENDMVVRSAVTNNRSSSAEKKFEIIE